MNIDSLNHFAQAIKCCESCGSRCTATLPATELAGAVKEVVTQLAPAWWVDPSPPAEYPLETLLLVLTYSYACGMFGSQDIADELEDRAERCALVRTLSIDALVLEEFRRENHQLLRRCLTAVLKGEGMARWIGGDRPVGAGGAGPEPAHRVGGAHDPELEAERRLLLAAQTDSGERDR